MIQIHRGNSIELFEAQDNNIHHNTAVNDRVFSELGGSSAMRAKNNIFSYNLVISNVLDARFVTTRGSGNPFGPVYSTKLYHNTVYFTGAKSQAFVCGDSCSTSILTVKNNIFWAEEKAAYTDGPITESNNLYWNSSGNPFVQFTGFSLSPSSKLANPQFVSLADKNFRVKSTSPAIDGGVLMCYQTDLDGVKAPQGAKNDMGAYELK